jgi:hypothetical protein
LRFSRSRQIGAERSATTRSGRPACDSRNWLLKVNRGAIRQRRWSNRIRVGLLTQFLGPPVRLNRRTPGIRAAAPQRGESRAAHVAPSVPLARPAPSGPDCNWPGNRRDLAHQSRPPRWLPPGADRRASVSGRLTWNLVSIMTYKDNDLYYSSWTRDWSHTVRRVTILA